MEINVKHEKEMVISLKGRLDTVTSQELLNFFAKEEKKEDLIIMDMKELEYISSAGLRALLAMKKEINGDNKAFEVHNLNDVCKEVFRVTGFSNILVVK